MRRINTAIGITFVMLLLSVGSAFAASTNYITLSTALITNAKSEINTYIQKYQSSKSDFSSIQTQQIESQYNSISDSIDQINKDEKSDTGLNLQNDYNALVNLNISNVKIPLLYSELFTFKAEYIKNLLSQYNAIYIPQIVNGATSANHQEALNDSSNISSLLTDIQTADTSIHTDYSTLADEQSLTNTTTNQAKMNSTLMDVEHNQQRILSDINQISKYINELNTL